MRPRGIAGLGLMLAAIGMAQHATAPRLLYWMFPTRSATPFGPFMNHSDFATWLVMALPLTAGYLIARLHSRRRNDGVAVGVADAFDNTAMWLTTAIGLMAAALVVGLSRSGLIAAVAGLGSLWVLSSATDAAGAPGAGCWLVSIATAAIGAAYANTNAITARVSETINLGLGGRQAIWRETWPMIKDFWLTGVGTGAYERAMIVYQQSPRVVYFNHAHNDYHSDCRGGRRPAGGTGAHDRHRRRMADPAEPVRRSYGDLLGARGSRQRPHRRRGAEPLGNRLARAGQRAAIRRARGNRDARSRKK